jgi:hypothetical protein
LARIRQWSCVSDTRTGLAEAENAFNLKQEVQTTKTQRGRAATELTPLFHLMEERGRGEEARRFLDSPLLGPLPTPSSWGEEENRKNIRVSAVI